MLQPDLIMDIFDQSQAEVKPKGNNITIYSLWFQKEVTGIIILVRLNLA